MSENKQSEVTAGTPSPERLGCAEALQALYLASSKLRLRVQQYGPKVKLFIEWDDHTAAMKNAETVLHNTGSHRPSEPEANEGSVC